MRKYGLILLAVLVLLMMPNNADAFLLGDAINMEHHYPEIGTIRSEVLRTVTAGTDDIWTFTGYYVVNPEDTSILVDFAFQGSWGYGNGFNGLVVNNIDAELIGVTIDTNYNGWDASRLSFDSDEVAFNWRNLTVASDTYFNAELDFGQSSAVPEPATMLLFGMGSVFTAFFRRRSC